MTLLHENEKHLYWYRARLVRIIDGDSIEVIIDMGLGIHKEEDIRLARIDAYEIRGEEKIKGHKAKDFVEDYLHGVATVLLTIYKRDKYGRLIAEVLVPKAGDHSNLSDALLESGHAVIYKGRT